MADTIAAVATGGGVSAIGVIRVSGDDAITIVSKVFRPRSGRSMANYESGRLVYGELLGTDGAPIDLCLCTVSRAPYSYTGENTAELHCHGSPVVLAEGLRALFQAGARQAGPGEFTKRAFLNGKMDLSQAAAVIDIIEAQTEAAARNALGQLKGALFRRVEAVYSDLLDIRSHYFAVIDYPDEDIEPFKQAEFEKTLELSAGELEKLIKSFERGRVLREGVKSAIVGRPNAGKSSLLNALLGYERAIVTPIPGTTRDTIEEKLTLGGVLLRLVDTAGIRRTEDAVEKIGVERALEAAREAELVIAVFDGSEELTGEDMEAIEAARGAKRSIAVVNKADLPQKIDLERIRASFRSVCVVSALDRTGLDRLDSIVREMFEGEGPETAGEIITSARQAEAISRAHASIVSALEALRVGFTPDAVLTEAEAGVAALGELLGKTVRSDVTDRIFSRFCVGK